MSLPVPSFKKKAKKQPVSSSYETASSAILECNCYKAKRNKTKQNKQTNNRVA